MPRFRPRASKSRLPRENGVRRTKGRAESRGSGVERETGAALCPGVRSPPAATKLSARTIRLEMRPAVSAVYSGMILTISGGRYHHGVLDRRCDPDRDDLDPHGEAIRGDRDRRDLAR